jgi:hypothetical protein
MDQKALRSSALKAAFEELCVSSGTMAPSAASLEKAINKYEKVLQHGEVADILGQRMSNWPWPKMYIDYEDTPRFSLSLIEALAEKGFVIVKLDKGK